MMLLPVFLQLLALTCSSFTLADFHDQHIQQIQAFTGTDCPVRATGHFAPKHI